MQWYILALGSAVLNALSTVTEKKTLFKEHAMEYATVISLIMFLLSLTFINKVSLSMPILYWFLLIIISVIDAIAFLYITKAVRHMELSESSPLFVFGPAITAVLAYIFLGEMLTMKHVGGIVGVTIGAYVLELKHFRNKKAEFLSPIKIIMQSKYIHYLLFGLVLYAVSAIIARYMLNTDNPQAISPYTLLVITHFFVALAFLFMIHKYHDGLDGIKHGLKSAGWLIFLAALFLFTSRILLTITLAIPVAEVALILGVRRLSSLFSTIIGGEIFQDKNLAGKVFACIIMIIGVLFIVT